MKLSARMDSRMEWVWQQQAFRLADLANDLMFRVLEAAAAYWDGPGVDPTDFCVQLVSPDSVVFGGTNRLRWTPAHGFLPDPSYCSAAFLERCVALGPVPQ